MTTTPPRRTADSPESRRAFLHRLPECGFVPPEQFVVAPPDDVKALRADIDDFCERFWTLAAENRHADWRALAARAAADPKSRVRLERLQPAGERSDLADSEFAGAQAMIVLALKELSTLAPPERASRRAAFLRDAKPPFSLWQRAAAIVRDHHADIAALDRPLIDRLTALGTGKSYARRAPLPASLQQAGAAAGWTYHLGETAVGSISRPIRSGRAA